MGRDTSSLADADFSDLTTNPSALSLCELLEGFPHVIQHTANERAVHLLANFLHDVAVAMHNYYEQTRILTSPPDDNMEGRLALLVAAQSVFKNYQKTSAILKNYIHWHCPLLKWILSLTVCQN